MGSSGAPSLDLDGQIRWRDHIELDISDRDLKVRVETFLDHLERASFDYARLDPDSGQIIPETLSGQDLLRDIASRRDLYERSGIAQVLADAGVMGDDHKFVIAQHDRPFDGTVQNGANTAFASIEGRNYPLRIELGTDYLQGAQYFDANGQTHPVSVEGVVANEIGHLATGRPGDQLTIDIENIIAVSLGAEQRVGQGIDFEQGSNGGYHSLLPVPVAPAPGLAPDVAPETQPPVPGLGNQ